MPFIEDGEYHGIVTVRTHPVLRRSAIFEFYRGELTVKSIEGKAHPRDQHGAPHVEKHEEGPMALLQTIAMGDSKESEMANTYLKYRGFPCKTEILSEPSSSP